jgi:hypothetical protein
VTNDTSTNRSLQQVALRPAAHQEPQDHAGSHRQEPAAKPGPRTLWGTPVAVFRAFGLAVLVPLFLALGMSMSYLGAFHQPTPHDLPVAVVGTSAETQVFAQKLTDADPGALSVRTVGTDAKARALIESRTVAGAYEATAAQATLLVSTAASESSSSVVEKAFLPIAYSEKLPFTVVDVVPSGPHDTTGQGLFFLLVGLSVGSYATAAALAAFAARLGIRWTIVTAVVMSGIVSGIAMTVAGPVFHVLEGVVWGTWLVGWLYSVAILLIGVGLHPILRHWTTAALTLLFVMLNFTSSGGIFAAHMSAPFFAGLNTFWNGAAWLDAAQTMQYFSGHAFGLDILRLGIWAVAGLGLTLLTHLLSRRRVRLANERVSTREEETVIAA